MNPKPFIPPPIPPLPTDELIVLFHHQITTATTLFTRYAKVGRGKTARVGWTLEVRNDAPKPKPRPRSKKKGTNPSC